MPITKILDEFEEEFVDRNMDINGNLAYREIKDVSYADEILAFLRSSLISLLEEDVRRMEGEFMKLRKRECTCVGSSQCNKCLTHKEVWEKNAFNRALSQEIAYKNNQIKELKK